jgi:hypothetical protein
MIWSSEPGSVMQTFREREDPRREDALRVRRDDARRAADARRAYLHCIMLSSWEGHAAPGSRTHRWHAVPASVGRPQMKVQLIFV